MKLTQDQIEYLKGYLSAFEDVSDSSWPSYCQDAIKECPLFKRHNPYEVWWDYVNQTFKQVKSKTKAL